MFDQYVSEKCVYCGCSRLKVTGFNELWCPSCRQFNWEDTNERLKKEELAKYGGTSVVNSATGLDAAWVHFMAATMTGYYFKQNNPFDAEEIALWSAQCADAALEEFKKRFSYK